MCAHVCAWSLRGWGRAHGRQNTTPPDSALGAALNGHPDHCGLEWHLKSGEILKSPSSIYSVSVRTTLLRYKMKENRYASQLPSTSRPSTSKNKSRDEADSASPRVTNHLDLLLLMLRTGPTRPRCPNVAAPSCLARPLLMRTTAGLECSLPSSFPRPLWRAAQRVQPDPTAADVSVEHCGVTDSNASTASGVVQTPVRQRGGALAMLQGYGDTPSAATLPKSLQWLAPRYYPRRVCAHG